MAVLITAENCAAHHDLLEAAYRFRHRFFVDRLGWEAIRRPDGREIDQFDGPHCAHAIGTEGGAITHYTRFLPTQGPHLLTHLYPEILQGNAAPTGPRYYEWTRGAVDPVRRAEKGAIDPATGGYYAAGAETCLALGLDGFVSQAHPVFLGRIMEAGWDVEPLALPTTYDGQPIVAFVMRLTPDTLAITRRKFGLAGPVLEEGVRAPRAPLPADAPLSLS